MSFHAQRFGRASRSYESAAAIQSRMAERLLNVWEGRNPSSILEFGCGTGLLTRRLRERFPKAFILATDASSKMLAEAGRVLSQMELEFSEQNADGTATASQEILEHTPFEMVVSNALVQWFSNLESHLMFAAQQTGPNGAYLFSGFERSNFPELNGLLAEPPFSYSNFPGHDSSSIAALAAKTGWQLAMIQTWEEMEIHPSPLNMLRQLQSLGSTRDPGTGGRLTRRSLEYLVSEYQRRFSESGGVRLTWRPWVAMLRRS